MKQKFNLLIALVVIFVGSKGNVIAISDVTLVFALILNLIVMFKRGIVLPVRFQLLSIGYFLLSCIYLYKFGWVNLSSTFRLYLKILYGFTVILILRENFFLLYLKIIVWFAKISLPLFCIQLVAYSKLKFVIGFIENNIPGLNYRSSWYVNNGFFTLNDNAIFRNSGMAWEPKGFANMLLVAMVINFFYNKFKFDRNFFILFITILTTVSTTGYVALFTLIPIIYIQNIDINFKPLLLGMFIITGLSIFQMDIMGNKILRELEEKESHLKYIDAETKQESVTLGRFGSMQLAFYDFPKNPLFGVGMQDAERTEGKHVHLVYVSGIADALSRFGLLGMLFLAFSYVQSINYLKRKFQFHSSWPIVLLFFSIFFASAVIISPLFFCFQFLYLIDDHVFNFPKIPKITFL